MSFTILLFLALSGTAVLGFASAWFLQSEKLRSLRKDKAQLTKRRHELKTALDDLTKENELNVLTVENLQHLLLEYEQKVFDLQRRLIEPKPLSNTTPRVKISLPDTLDSPKDEMLPDPVTEKNGSAQHAAADLIHAFKKGVLLEQSES